MTIHVAQQKQKQKKKQKLQLTISWMNVTTLPRLQSHLLARHLCGAGLQCLHPNTPQPCCVTLCCRTTSHTWD